MIITSITYAIRCIKFYPKNRGNVVYNYLQFFSCIAFSLLDFIFVADLKGKTTLYIE